MDRTYRTVISGVKFGVVVRAECIYEELVCIFARDLEFQITIAAMNVFTAQFYKDVPGSPGLARLDFKSKFGWNQRRKIILCD